MFVYYAVFKYGSLLNMTISLFAQKRNADLAGQGVVDYFSDGKQGASAGKLHCPRRAYLKKAFTYPHVSEALGQCEKRLETNSKYIEVISGHVPVRVWLWHILYMEDCYKQRIIFITEGEIHTSMTLDALEEMTDDSFFARCHLGLYPV